MHRSSPNPGRALRRSRLDLDDGAIAGDRQRTRQFGLNGYLGRQLRLSLNHGRHRAWGDGEIERARITQLRTQWMF